MPIEITPKKTTGVERLLAVTVPADDVRDAEEREARRYATKVRLPGFRPGKAPAAVVRKRFADAIRQQTVEALVQEAYKEAMGREELKPIGQPHVHDVKFEEGQPLTFELHLEVSPDVALARSRDSGSSGTQAPVTDQVTDQTRPLREQRATWSPVDEKPGPGDQVTVVLSDG